MPRTDADAAAGNSAAGAVPGTPDGACLVLGFVLGSTSVSVVSVLHVIGLGRHSFYCFRLWPRSGQNCWLRRRPWIAPSEGRPPAEGITARTLRPGRLFFLLLPGAGEDSKDSSLRDGGAPVAPAPLLPRTRHGRDLSTDQRTDPPILFSSASCDRRHLSVAPRLARPLSTAALRRSGVSSQPPCGWPMGDAARLRSLRPKNKETAGVPKSHKVCVPNRTYTLPCVLVRSQGSWKMANKARCGARCSCKHRRDFAAQPMARGVSPSTGFSKSPRILSTSHGGQMGTTRLCTVPFPQGRGGVCGMGEGEAHSSFWRSTRWREA